MVEKRTYRRGSNSKNESENDSSESETEVIKAGQLNRKKTKSTKRVTLGYLNLQVIYELKVRFLRRGVN